MDAQLKRLLMAMVGLMLGVGSCTFGVPPAPTSDNGAAALTLTSLVQTVTAQAATAPVDAPPTLSTEGLPTATEFPSTVPPTAAPIIFTPTFTVVPSPTVPMVSVTTGTNCRSGPGREYFIIGGAPVGVKFVLVGKNTITDYWIIRLQDGRECWLWGRYAVVEGNVASLPEYAIPATPLPPVGSISGTIRDIGGALVPGATVIAQLSNRSFTSRADGTYSFDNLGVGIEYITVDASAYAPAHRSVNVVQGNPSTVDFQLRSLSVPSGGATVIEGRVLVNSSPAAGVTVWVWARGQPVTTDNNGRYRIQLGPAVGYYDILLLAQSGTMRGAVELFAPQPETVLAPDIILLPR